MRFLLDTNICIYLIRHQPQAVLDHFRQQEVGDVAVSVVTVAELQHGVAKSRQVERNAQALEQFLLPLVIVPFDVESTAVYGRIRATLERQGTPIGALDTLIAAHALRLDLSLVTNNVKEFERVPDLRVVNWAE